MPLSYFSRLFPRLQDRIRQDVPSALPLNNDSLRRFLDSMVKKGASRATPPLKPLSAGSSRTSAWPSLKASCWISVLSAA